MTGRPETAIDTPQRMDVTVEPQVLQTTVERPPAIEDALLRASGRGKANDQTPHGENPVGGTTLAAERSIKRISGSITRRSLGLNMILGLGGLHAARRLSGPGWSSAEPGLFATPVVLLNSVPTSLEGTWQYKDRGTDGSILINREVVLIVYPDATAELTYGLVQSQINGCVQQDIWDWIGNCTWYGDSTELQFNGSGTRYESFTCSPSQNNKLPTSVTFTFSSVKIGATQLSLNPSPLRLTDLNTFKPLTQITLTKIASAKSPTWGDWVKMDANATDGLAVASWGLDRLDLFVHGPDRDLYHKSRAGNSWSSSWEKSGAQCAGTPAAVSWGEGRIDVFVMGLDQQVWHLDYGSRGWSSWEPLGGKVLYGCAAASTGLNQVSVFATGVDHNIYSRSFDRNVWTDWRKVNAFSTSAPAAVADSSNELILACAGGDNNLDYNVYRNSVYEGWVNAGGDILDVAIASWGPNEADFFVRGVDSEIYQKSYVDGSPHDWVKMNGTSQYPVAAVAPRQGHIELFAIGVDHAVYQKTYK